MPNRGGWKSELEGKLQIYLKSKLKQKLKESWRTTFTTSTTVFTFTVVPRCINRFLIFTLNFSTLYFPFNLCVFTVCIYFTLCCVSLQVGLCLGSKLESLALPGSSITEASLLALLPRLTSLRRLDLRGLDSLFMSGAFLSKEEHRQQVFMTTKASVNQHCLILLRNPEPDPRSEWSHHISATLIETTLMLTKEKQIVHVIPVICALDTAVTLRAPLVWWWLNLALFHNLVCLLFVLLEKLVSMWLHVAAGVSMGLCSKCCFTSGTAVTGPEILINHLEQTFSIFPFTFRRKVVMKAFFWWWVDGAAPPMWLNWGNCMLPGFPSVAHLVSLTMVLHSGSGGGGWGGFTG